MGDRGWPFGDSEMHRLIRRHDWAATSLGPIRRWPARLRQAVETMLDSPYPALVLWGPEAIQLYNDRDLALLGSRHPAALGRPARETWPEISDQIVAAQTVLRNAGAVEYVDRRFDVVGADGVPDTRWLTGGWTAIRDRDGTILGVLVANIDTSSRVRAEEAVRRSETRQAYLVSLGDALRPLGDAVVIQQAASRLLRERLRADRVTYWEAAESGYDIVASAESVRHGLPSAVGHPLRLADYDPETAEVFRQGASAGRDDIAAVESLTPEQRTAFAWGGTRAYYVWPLIKSARFVACLAAYFSQPHAWTEDEIELIRETAERTWAAVERARAERAMRESEERLQLLLDSTDENVVIIDRDCRFCYCNPAAHRLLAKNGLDPDPRLGQFALDAFPDIVRTPLRAAIRQTMERRESARAEFAFLPGGREYSARAFPMNDGGASVFLADVTERNAVQRQARDNAERQAYLLRLSDALRPLSDPDAIKAVAARVLGQHLEANRVGYAEASSDGERVELTGVFADGVDAKGGVHRYDAVPAEVVRAARAGQAFVCNDLARNSSLTVAEKERAEFDQIGAAVSLPLHKSGSLAAILFVHSREPRTWTSLELALMQETVERTWDAVQRARAERALAESEARFRLFADASEDLLWIRNVETLRYEFLSSGFRKVFEGVLSREPVGLDDYLEFIHSDDLDAVRNSIPRVIQGEPSTVHYRIVAPGAGGDIVWLRSAVFPLRDAAGLVTHIGGIAQNVTEERKAAERMRVMIGELQHRTRNLLAVVRSIAEQTMAETGPTPAFQQEFGERLSALSRAQGLLSVADETPITIEALVRLELDALAAAGSPAARITLAGPPVRVRNSQVQTLALALHELATNARKYGALSGKDGRVEVAWSVREARKKGRRLVLEWIERTDGLGRAALEKLNSGYGRTLIERGLPYALGAETSYAIDESGVRCVIDMPLDRMEDREGTQ